MTRDTSSLSGIIILLGDKNDSDGTLTSIALERCRSAYDAYVNRPGCKILPTGGFGELSSSAKHPHAHYLTQYLIELGVDEEDILPPALGRNTLENILLARDIVGAQDTTHLYVVTSDFHRRRAQYILEQLFEHHSIKMVLSLTALPLEHIEALEEHESVAWDKLLSTVEQVSS